MFAIIDIETTGGNAVRDRITEIAIILHDGYRTHKTYSSLVNPEIPIPGYITDITGINDAMVADAPRFYEIAREVVQLTEGCVFVAHNVNFDYSFIREEFRKLAYDYKRERLCTVRNSRRLVPGLASYSLGRLCANLGIPIRSRHRAMGDAEATAILMEYLVRLDPHLVGKPKRDPYQGIPVSIPRENLAALPEDPGIYFFHGPQGEVIWTDKAANIRKEALRILKAGQVPGGQPLDGQLQEVTWELTGSELVASLQLLAGSTKVTKPVRRYRSGVFAYRDQRDYIRLAIGPITKGSQPLAEFMTEEDAQAALGARVRRFELCPVLAGLEPSKGRCSHFPGGGCHGACAGLESPAQYNTRLEEALGGLGFPHPRFLLLSEGRTLEEVSVVCMENGSCMAYGFLDATMGWDNPASVVDLLKPFPNPAEGGKLVRNYLPGVPVRQIVPF